MIRIREVLIAVIVGMGLGATALVAQPAGCDFCGNHFWYNEHIHGDELHSLYDNKQNHGGEWFPYNCGVDHRLCDEEGVNMALAEAADSLTGAAERSDWNPVRFARLLETLAERGIQAKETSVGLDLFARCQKQGYEIVEVMTVALSKPAQQRVRQATTPLIQGP